MVGRPDLNNAMLLQILLSLLSRGFLFARDQVVPSFWRAEGVDGEGDELSHARPNPDLPYLLEVPANYCAHLDLGP